MQFKDLRRCLHGYSPSETLRTPTFLERREDMSADLGVDLFLKREDMLDDLGCGHKIRKLNYAIGDALRCKSTVLITVGSLPSSQCVAVAAAAKRHCLSAHLLYIGDHQRKPRYPQGNYLIAILLSPKITWMECTAWKNYSKYVAQIADAEYAQGGQPYFIPPGISTLPGLVGSIELGYELAEQIGSEDKCWVVAAAGSGGTCLGISIAARLLNLPWNVVGVCIAGTKRSVERHTSMLRMLAAKAWQLDIIKGARIKFHDGALGDSYDKPCPNELETMVFAMERYNIILDPNYMVKTLIGLRQLIEVGEIPRGSKVVLIHSGGTLGIFGDAPSLREWYIKRLGNLVSKS